MTTTYKKHIAEALGTYMMVLCGTGAAVINDITGDVTHVGVAISFGLIVMIVIYTLGHISGAHINPAVSLSFMLLHKLPARLFIPYVLAQCVGAIGASYTLSFMFWQENHGYGLTLPIGADMQSFILEYVLSFMLMLVILFVSNGNYHHLTGVMVGATVMLEAMFGGPISGASMNPARSLGPAIAAGEYQSLWLYIVAPCLGTVSGGWIWAKMR